MTMMMMMMMMMTPVLICTCTQISLKEGYQSAKKTDANKMVKRANVLLSKQVKRPSPANSLSSSSSSLAPSAMVSSSSIDMASHSQVSPNNQYSSSSSSHVTEQSQSTGGGVALPPVGDSMTRAFSKDAHRMQKLTACANKMMSHYESGSPLLQAVEMSSIR
jgi:hypothetical protein